MKQEEPDYWVERILVGTGFYKNKNSVPEFKNELTQLVLVEAKKRQQQQRALIGWHIIRDMAQSLITKKYEALTGSYRKKHRAKASIYFESDEYYRLFKTHKEHMEAFYTDAICTHEINFNE
jgi:hypothetical protein